MTFNANEYVFVTGWNIFPAKVVHTVYLYLYLYSVFDLIIEFREICHHQSRRSIVDRQSGFPSDPFQHGRGRKIEARKTVDLRGSRALIFLATRF